MLFFEDSGILYPYVVAVARFWRDGYVHVE